MDRRSYATMALMAGLGILAAAVVVIATRPRADSHPAALAFDSVRLAAELIRLRIDGGDSGAHRRALKEAALQLQDRTLSRALVAFADGKLEEAAREPAENPFERGVRGWVLVELGRRPEAAEELRQALKEAQPDWEYRPLFESALRKAE
jgi:hypothetical protein